MTRIQYLSFYHPYSGGNNEAFDHTSKMILAFKQGKPHAVSYWANVLKDRIYRITQEPFYIATVPSSTQGKAHPGFQKLVPMLGHSFKILNSRSNLLQRDATINKLASGGNRAVEVHIASLSVPFTCDDYKPVILLDDVTTTGNSMRAAISKLERAGYSVIAAIALGKTTR